MTIVKQKKCKKCGKKIPKQRLLALPETKVCVKCSTEQPKIGVVIYDNTMPILELTDDIERLKQVNNQHKSQ